MKIKDISPSGKPLFNMENLEKAMEPSGDDSLQEIGKGKLKSLKSSMKEIDFLISQREALSKSIFGEVERIKKDIDDFMLTNTVGSDALKERAALRQKQIDISELQLNEKVTCWKDVALLKRELRELQRDLSEKEERVSMFNKILEN